MSTAQSLDYSAQNNGGPDLDPHPSAAFALIAIIATAVLFIAMTALLFYEAVTQRAPGNAVIVQGDERWSGVTLSIEGPMMDRALTGTLDKANKYVVTFFLDPGMYSLSIQSNGRDLMKPLPVPLERQADTIGVDLRQSGVQPPATQPATQPTSGHLI